MKQKLIIWGGVLLVILFLTRNLIDNLVTSDHIEVTVTNLDSRTIGNISNKNRYFVFTDKEVFINEDEPWFGKFDSSNLYGSLVIGKKYRFHVVGRRVPLFSWYRNVVSAEEVNN